MSKLLFENTVEGEDFDLGFPVFVFGPCYRCLPRRLRKRGLLSVKDDNDLEFDHGFTVGFAPEFVSLPGITIGEPEEVLIIDDGRHKINLYQNFSM